MAETPPTLKVYSWSDVVDMSARLAALADGHRARPTAIVAVLRGGAFPGLTLSHALGVKKLYAIRTSTTVDETVRADRAASVVEGVEGLPELSAEHVLVVDDVTNTGTTLSTTVKALQTFRPSSSITTAALVWDTVATSGAEALTTCAADLWVDRVHAWAVFPWEAPVQL